MEDAVVILNEDEFFQQAAEHMLRWREFRRRLDSLIFDLQLYWFGRGQWWPEGLPILPCNVESRLDYIKQVWGQKEHLVNHKGKTYKLSIEDVLGLYYVIRMEEQK